MFKNEQKKKTKKKKVVDKAIIYHARL